MIIQIVIYHYNTPRIYDIDTETKKVWGQNVSRDGEIEESEIEGEVLSVQKIEHKQVSPKLFDRLFPNGNAL
jgi:hypothetical protein